MSSEKYIKELKSNLSSLDPSKIDEIVKELKSIIDSKETYEDLVVRFGLPSELSENYLEGVPRKIPFKKKVYTKTQKVLAVFGICFIVLILIAIFMINRFTSDPFDYSKYNGKTIDSKLNTNWTELSNIEEINIKQARVVFYSSNSDILFYSCQGEIDNESKILNIKQSKCIVKLPNKKFNLKINQANVSFMELKNEIVLYSEQSNVNFNTKNNKYNFDNLAIKESELSNSIPSNPNGVKVSGEILQTSFDKYEY
jgi:hypothetical protein